MSIRDDFFEAQLNAALWDVAVSIKRGNPLPLDANSVFNSYAALEEYAAGPLAYPGQIVAVVNADSTILYYLDHNLHINMVNPFAGSAGQTLILYGGSATDNITLQEDDVDG